MINDKPVIGLTSNIEMLNGNLSYTLYLSYAEAVYRAGGTPIVLPLGNEELVETWVNMCDGILLTGGNDVHPFHYGHSAHDELGLTTPDLDQSQIMIIQYARQQNKPLFGICRGSHLINIALGGTMIQDIHAEIPDNLNHLDKGSRDKTLTHRVKIDRDSTLFNVLQEEELLVNSFHHQAIGKLGEGLRCVAIAPDGVKEAIENEDGSIIGTQFHPEELGKFNDQMQQLLKVFVEKCRKV